MLGITLACGLSILSLVSGAFHEKRFLEDIQARTILENGHARETNYPDTKIDISAYDFKTYPNNATEISYKGRWDSKKVSWWA